MNGNFPYELTKLITLGLPECVALTMLTLALLKLKFEWKKIFIIGLAVDFTVLFFRLLVLNTGIHTAIAILAMAVMVAYMFQISKFPSMIASTISMLYLFICELLVFKFYKSVLLFDVDNLTQNKLYLIIFY